MKKQNKKRIFNCSEVRSIQDLVQVQARPVIVGENQQKAEEDDQFEEFFQIASFCCSRPSSLCFYRIDGHKNILRNTRWSSDEKQKSLRIVMKILAQPPKHQVFLAKFSPPDLGRRWFNWEISRNPMRLADRVSFGGFWGFVISKSSQNYGGWGEIGLRKGEEWRWSVGRSWSGLREVICSLWTDRYQVQDWYQEW